MIYVGETQLTGHLCVFASIVGAVNRLAGQPIWTQQTFFDAWEKAGRPHENFATLASIAVNPVSSKVSYIARDSLPPLSRADYLQLIDDCLKDGGLAILSMQNASVASGTLIRGGSWHMLTVSDRTGNVYDVWDTMGSTFTVTADQLLTHVPYGTGGVLAVHLHHDLLLLRPVP